MQINSIKSYDCSPRKVLLNKAQDMAFGSKKEESRDVLPYDSKKSSNALRNAAIAMMFLLPAGAVVTGCDKEDDYTWAKAEAYANANSSSDANVNDTVIVNANDSSKGRDTIFIKETDYDTVYVDTGSYHHTTDTIELWKERYVRPIPLDTLAKHLTDWDIDNADTVGNRNIIHYEYTRPWEYNTRVIANMNQLESGYDKKVLVHDVEVLDYKGKHQYYGKEVRRIPEDPVTLEYYNGTKVNTDKGYFLEFHKNKGDKQNASILGGTSLQERYFLQTAGDSVKVFKENAKGIFVEDGRATKGYLGKNTIMLRDLIGEYSTEDHLTDVNVVAVDDETLKAAYVRKRDEYEASEK